MTGQGQDAQAGGIAPAPQDLAAAQAALSRPLALTRAGLVAERLVRAFWPLWTVVLLALGAVLLGLHESAPVEAVWAGGLLSVAGAGWTLWQGVRGFRWPSRADAQERLDASLPGRPLQALGDRQAVGTGDPASEAVWRAHLRRMAARLSGAKAVPGDFRLASRDPYALRYVAATVFAIALVFGSVLKVTTVADAARGGAPVLAAGPAWEGWVEPPAYTGRPALYLNDVPEGLLSLPLGTRVSLRLYGEVGALTLAETVSGRVGEGIPPASAPTQDFEIAQAGDLTIAGEGGRTWSIALDPDLAPTVELDGPVEREAAGTMRQVFTAEDDYGVMAGSGRFTLDLEAVDRRYGLAAAPDAMDPIEFDLPMPIAGRRDLFSLEIVEDFSKHPWVGLPVEMQVQVEDAQGQIGLSDVVSLAMPGRTFFEPVARALVEQRRDLLWAEANARRVAQVLRTITWQPEDVIRDSSAYLQLRLAIRRLEAGIGPDGLNSEVQEDVAEALWQVALQLEEGDLSNALERLRRAQDQLSEAMRNGATDEEIARLMQELREAMQDYIRQLAQQQQQQGDQGQQQAQNMQEMSGDQLEEMLQRLQQLMEEGRMAEAQQLMEQLRQMMENMQVTQGQQGQQGQSPGQQAMEGLAETLRNQQGLSDESFDELQRQFQQGQQGQQPGQQGQQGQGQQGQGQQGQGQGQQFGQGQQGQGQGQQPGQGQGGQGGQGMPDAETLAERQRQLREELDRQSRGLPGAGTPEGDAARDALGRAGEAMEDAEDALGAGDLAEAIDDQSRAMDALREGMRNLGEALAQQQQGQQGQQGQAMGQGNPQDRRDPLGREQGTDGTLGSNENLLQGDDVYRRARDLLDEIRRRSGEQDRPELELEYLRRLLDRF